MGRGMCSTIPSSCDGMAGVCYKGKMSACRLQCSAARRPPGQSVLEERAENELVPARLHNNASQALRRPRAIEAKNVRVKHGRRCLRATSHDARPDRLPREGETRCSARTGADRRQSGASTSANVRTRELLGGRCIRRSSPKRSGGEGKRLAREIMLPTTRRRPTSWRRQPPPWSRRRAKRTACRQTSCE